MSGPRSMAFATTSCEPSSGDHGSLESQAVSLELLPTSFPFSCCRGGLRPQSSQVWPDGWKWGLAGGKGQEPEDSGQAQG